MPARCNIAIYVLFSVLFTPWVYASKEGRHSDVPAPSPSVWSITSTYRDLSAINSPASTQPPVATLGSTKGCCTKRITRLIFPGPHPLDDERKEVKDGDTINGFNVKIVYTSQVPTEKIFKGVYLTEAPHSVLTRVGTTQKRWLIWFHGNAETAREAAVYVSALFNTLSTKGLKKFKWSILIVEYPGFDGTDGFPQAPELEDMTLEWHNWLRRRSDTNCPTYLFGRSIGTPIATYWASQHKVSGLLLDAPFQGIGSIASAWAPYPGISLLAEMLFSGVLETDSFLHQVQTPTLVITRNKDEVIPEPVGINQYQAIKTTNKFATTHLSLASSKHNGFEDNDWETYLSHISQVLFQE